MRHYKKSGMKLGTDASHTKAMKKSLVIALFQNDRIKTTITRAKAIRPDVDRVITWAKRGDLAARRLAIKKLGDKELVREIFEKAAQGLWADRNGGYTRILKLGTRKGDSAEIVIIELVNEPVVAKAAPAVTPAPTPVAVAEPAPEPAVQDVAEEDASFDDGATDYHDAGETEENQAESSVVTDGTSFEGGETDDVADAEGFHEDVASE